MKLSREQRKAIFAGEHPSITFPGDKPCPVEVGFVHPLSRQVRIRVLEIRRNKKGEHTLRYTLENDRPRLLRRSPTAHVASKPTRREGESREDYVARVARWKAQHDREPTASEIARAAEESSYTGSAHGIVSDAGECVSAEEQSELTARAKKVAAERREDEQAKEEERRQERAVRDRLRETLHGLDWPARQALLASIEREIVQAKMRQAA